MNSLNQSNSTQRLQNFTALNISEEPESNSSSNLPVGSGLLEDLNPLQSFENQISTAKILSQVAGFADGINPLDSVNRWITDQLNITPEYKSQPEYLNAHAQGIEIRNQATEVVHTALDLGGLIPGIGEPLDLLNGGIYLAQGDLVNVGFSAAALIPLGGVFAAGGKGVKMIETEALSKETIAEVLEQTTVQGSKIAEGIRNGSIKVNLLGKELFEKVLRRFKVKPQEIPYTLAVASKNRIYVQRNTENVFRDIVHEGTHALDDLSGFKGSDHDWERRAFYHDGQFQKWVDGEKEFDGFNEMMKFIYKNY